MQRLAQNQSQRDDHTDRRSQSRLHCRIGAEQIGREERDFAGQAYVGAAVAPVGDDHQRADESRTDRDQQQPGELHRQRSAERHHRMGTHPPGSTEGRVQFTTLALETDQQADTERNQQSCDGLGQEHLIAVKTRSTP